MRILLVHPGPDFSVHDVLTGWLEAFRELGVEAVPYNLNDRLIFYSHAFIDTGEKDETGHAIVNGLEPEQILRLATQGLSHALYTFWPDAVIFVSGFFVSSAELRLIRLRNHKLVILHTESPYQDDQQLLRGDMADLNLLNDPVNLGMFRENSRAEYMPHAYRPSVHYPRTGPRDPAKASDLCFIGTAFKSRVAFFEALDLDGTDTMIAGAWWGKTDPDSPLAKHVAIELGADADCVDNADTAEYYRHAKIGINLYRRESESAHENDPAEALSPREIEMAACGLFFLRDPRPEGDEVFKGILPTFSGPGDASEKLRWWLDPAHDGLREKRAVQAREAVADRTFVNNAKRLLKLLEDL